MLLEHVKFLILLLVPLSNRIASGMPVVRFHILIKRKHGWTKIFTNTGGLIFSSRAFVSLQTTSSATYGFVLRTRQDMHWSFRTSGMILFSSKHNVHLSATGPGHHCCDQQNTNTHSAGKCSRQFRRTSSSSWKNTKRKERIKLRPSGSCSRRS